MTALSDEERLARIRVALKGARGLALDHDETALDAELEAAIYSLDHLMFAPRAAAQAALAAPSRDAGLNVERLHEAFVFVEANYIHRPDRTARAYWSKIAAAYNRATALASPADQEAE